MAIRYIGDQSVIYLATPPQQVALGQLWMDISVVPAVLNEVISLNPVTYQQLAGGATGPQGPQGIQGIQGIQGVMGSQGTPGSLGPMGPAVFLEADDGQDGDVGPPGIQGVRGPQGPIGPAIYMESEVYTDEPVNYGTPAGPTVIRGRLSIIGATPVVTQGMTDIGTTTTSTVISTAAGVLMTGFVPSTIWVVNVNGVAYGVPLFAL